MEAELIPDRVGALSGRAAAYTPRVPSELASLLEPERSALVVFECLEGVLGERSFLPGLAASAREAGLVERVRELAGTARRCGVRVLYCTLAKRADGVGDPGNLPLQRRLRAAGGVAAPPDLGGVVARLAPQPGDIEVRREHGLTGFHASGLDDLLRHSGVRSVVLTGVSLNLGVLGTAIEAANRGYHVVIPADGVAADPPGYAEALLRHTLRHIAWITTCADVARHWADALAHRD